MLRRLLGRLNDLIERGIGWVYDRTSDRVHEWLASHGEYALGVLLGAWLGWWGVLGAVLTFAGIEWRDRRKAKAASALGSRYPNVEAADDAAAAMVCAELLSVEAIAAHFQTRIARALSHYRVEVSWYASSQLLLVSVAPNLRPDLRDEAAYPVDPHALVGHAAHIAHVYAAIRYLAGSLAGHATDRMTDGPRVMPGSPRSVLPA